MAIPKEILFSDIDLRFQAHPITGRLNVLKNEDAIKQSVKNVVLYNFYEKPYNVDFGGNILDMLFEPLTPLSVVTIKEAIRSTINNYEPRANLIDVKIKPIDTDNNTVDVSIIFSILNNPEPLSTSIIVEKVR